jgi:hypothetical protein
VSKFIGIIVGVVEIVAGIAVALFIPGGVIFGDLLIKLGAGTLVAGVGTLITGAITGDGSNGSAPGGGITTASRNPVSPWVVVYGRTVVGGTIVFLNEWGDHNKYLDIVIVLACHSCKSVDALLLDKQMIQFNSSGGAWDGHAGDSFGPAQQVVSIFHISRTNNVVTCVLNANIPYAVPGVHIKIQGITGDRTLNGRYPIAQIISQVAGSPGSLTFTYINGGIPSIVDLEGQAVTQWPEYGQKIHMEVLDGTHTATFPGMLTGTPNDGDTGDLIINADNPWNATCKLLGRTAVFLRLHYDAPTWAGGLPTISFLVHGKHDIYDPRLGAYGSPGTTAYTENMALCTADHLANATWGFKAAYGTEIPTASLIAQANICDEAVPLAAGGTEPRYTINGQFNLSIKRGEILQNLLTAGAARLTYTGGQFQVWTGSWYGSSPGTAPTMAQMAGPFQWKPTGSIRELFNGVKGTYISPSNNWQAGDIPPYAQDSIHGYTASGPAIWSSSTSYVIGNETTYLNVGYVAIANNTNQEPDTHSSSWVQHYQDANLTADGGDRRYMEIQLPFTVSAATAQRIEKILLMRSRMSGTGTFRYNMAGYAMTVMDIIQMTLSPLNFTNKQLEVIAHRFTLNDQEQDGSTVTLLGTEIDVQETDSSIYDWSPTEELTPQGYQQQTVPSAYTPAPPTNLILESDAFTAVVVKGAAQDAIAASWTSPVDGYVANGGHIEIQYQPYQPPITAGTVGISAYGVATFSSPVLISGYVGSLIIIGSSVYTLTTVSSSTVGALSPAPTLAISAATYTLAPQNAVWTGLPSVPSTVTQIQITGVVDGQLYTVEIRSVNAAGIPSAWVAGQVTAAGARAPLPWQPGGETPVSSDTQTQDQGFIQTLVYPAVDANGNTTPTLQISGFYPVNLPGTAAAPNITAVTVAQFTTGGSIAGGSTVQVILEAFDNTSGTNPGISLFSLPVTVNIPAGTNTNQFTLSGFTFDSHTSGYRSLIGASGIDSLTKYATLRSGTLPTSLTFTSIPNRTLGPTDTDADHLHVQAFDVLHGGPWALTADGPLSGSVVHLPLAVGFTTNQFQNYPIELLRATTGALPIAHGTIASHDAAGNFTIANVTGWTVAAGDLIRCGFKFSAVTPNSFTDPNVINHIYTGGNTGNDAGAEAWVLAGGTVQQTQSIASNTTTGWTINGTFNPPITTSSQIVLVYPTPIADLAANTYVAASDFGAVPTVASIPLPNVIGSIIAVRVFTESVNLAVDSTNYPMRLAYVAGKQSSGVLPTVTAVTFNSLVGTFNGALQLELLANYTPPTDANFRGVHVYGEFPDYSGTVTGFQLDVSQLDNNSAPVPQQRIDFGKFPVGPLDSSGSYTVNLPQQAPPPVGQTYRIYLCAYGANYDAPLIAANLTGPSPSLTVAVGPAPTAGLGQEYAPLVTNLALLTTQTRPFQGSYQYRWGITWQDPIGSANLNKSYSGYSGVNIVLNPLQDTVTGLPLGLSPTSKFVPANNGIFTTDWAEIPVHPDTWLIAALSVDLKGRQNTYSQSISPVLQLTTPTLDPTGTVTSGTLLTNVTGFSVSALYGNDKSGVFELIITPSFTAPTKTSDPMWSYIAFVAEVPASSGNFVTLGYPSLGNGIAYDDKAYIPRQFFPTAAQTWNFWAISVDVNGRLKYPTAGTFGTSPAFSLTIQPQAGAAGSAAEFAPLVTGASASAVYSLSTDGTEQYQFTAAWTDPVSNSFQGVTAIVVFTGGKPIPLGDVAPGIGTYLSDPWAVNSGATGTIYLCSYDASGRTNPIVPGTTPGFSFTIAIQTTGSMDMSRALASTLGGGLQGGSGALPSVHTGAGLTLSSSQVAVFAGNGITLAGGTTGVNAAGGLSFSGSQVVTNPGDGLTLSAGQILVFAGNGITLAGGSTGVNASGGLTAGSGQVVIVAGNGITTAGGSAAVNAAGGLTFTGSQLVANPAGGLTLSGATIVVNSGDGITTAGGILAVNPSTGIAFSGGQLVASIGSGLTASGGAIVVNPDGSSLVLSGGKVGVSNTYVYPGTVLCSQLQAGTISATISLSSASLTLNSNGVTTSVNNTADPTGGHGITISNNSTFVFATNTETGFRCYNGSRTLVASLDAASILNPRLYFLDGSSNIIVINANKIAINGTQVVGPRQTGVGVFSGSTLAQLITYVQSMYTAINNFGAIS